MCRRAKTWCLDLGRKRAYHFCCLASLFFEGPQRRSLEAVPGKNYRSCVRWSVVCQRRSNHRSEYFGAERIRRIQKMYVSGTRVGQTHRQRQIIIRSVTPPPPSRFLSSTSKCVTHLIQCVESWIIPPPRPPRTEQFSLTNHGCHPQ